MKHYYSTIDGIVTTFSDIHCSAAKGESILVHMERAQEHGFDTAEFLLPHRLHEVQRLHRGRVCEADRICTE
ncbi:hypothetical protein [Selenomonas sp. oral taxon 920]|uniref:hypothetical protein n=1 Tax=Selenomonas sp. oral taxon 920 TaxID=1884263 RepID=UPI001F469D38|nr:hypothetical protein [Selenomonas sp. oral taxon 920]